MDIFEAIDKRYSCRKYKPEKDEREKILTMIEQAGKSPSACNSQPWHFVVVDDEEKREKIAKATQKGAIGINKFADCVPAFIVIVKESGGMTSRIAKLVSSRDYSPFDLGIATESLALSAKALGLDTCIMGWFDEKKVMETLSLPKGKTPELILAVGYAEGDGKNPKKKEIDEICSFNAYGKKEDN